MAEMVGHRHPPEDGGGKGARTGSVTAGSLVVGYASGCGAGDVVRRELDQQARVIARECERRGLELMEVVREREPSNGRALTRPGFAYALERIALGDASGLVVSELCRITRSAAELGKVIEWLVRSHARLVAAAQAFDTEEVEGQLAAGLLVEVARWESARLSERTRTGLRTARRSGRRTGRPAVVDDPDLRARIAQMRADGMTLQAIADRLNEEGVPTVRGGAKWRHSSVQAAAGYVRRPRTALVMKPGRGGARLRRCLSVSDAYPATPASTGSTPVRTWRARLRPPPADGGTSLSNASSGCGRWRKTVRVRGMVR